MACWKILTLFGLVLNPVGVIVLFLYVLPTGGITGQWERSEVDEAELKLERRWDLLSAIGLWSVIIGIALQGVGVWFAP
jgi:hypothetical protein